VAVGVDPRDGDRPTVELVDRRWLLTEVSGVKTGVLFPTLELPDPSAARDFAQAAEGMGFSHLVAWEHVAGADLSGRPTWTGPPTLVPIHEPLVLFGFLAGLTEHIELVTGVLALPQRQGVLVAKQAAEVDILSGGRLRLGVGIGWAEPEFQALNEDYRNRGRRIDEQIQLLRALFTQEVVHFDGAWHRVDAMGIRPLPRQQPIPVWLGGHADVSLRRVAALGDGWMSLVSPEEAEADGYLDRLRTYTAEAGRSAEEVGIEATVSLTEDLLPQPVPRMRTPDQWRRDVQRWRELGATHLTVNSMGAGLTSAQAHVEALERFLDAIAP
jgi:probable F420-dependent oxidoreductase